MKGEEEEKERDGEKVSRVNEIEEMEKKRKKIAIKVEETSKIKRGEFTNEEKQQTMKKEEKMIWRERKTKSKYRLCQKHDL